MYINPQLITLYSFLKKHNIKADVLDLEVELGIPRSEEEVHSFGKKARELLSSYDFDIVGISCFSSFHYLASIRAAKICKELNPNCLIVVGGYHPTARPDDFIFPDQNLFDYVVKGEGEIALLNICKGNKSKNRKTEIVGGEPLDLNGNMHIDWQGYKYTKPDLPIDLFLNRGCPYRCAFCSESLKNDLGYKCRIISVENAVKEIKRVIKTIKPNRIRLQEACFGFNKKWLRDFLNALIKEKIDKWFWAETRVDIMDKADIDLFSKLNFQIDFGIESCSKKMLLAMKKTNDPSRYLEKVEAIIDYANKKKFRHAIYIMFNHPGETEETMKETLDFLKKLLLKRNKIYSEVKAQNYFFVPGCDIDLNTKYYNDNFGTVIKYRNWWLRNRLQRTSAADIIPSKEAKGAVEWEDPFNKLLDEFEKRYPHHETKNT